ncbi:type I-F CRISPR-associated endoribonuclease Cas6/Csy4 [Nitrosococcus watsonii]|uniref:CRISPR-associated protein, Csy4 family n=1 Tax=Nitrosococcus watsoni (strain C-113) TaxID=105559 RepID=D8KBI3_NITWC|nr:type I-F CRISPR-associated endoribonuclease Cas6/Csy4 [Nitrosococcus watsonii]ADJ29630.1 CRISPR-associated protein, Csy4 family [Nitrosococcus watsonii C-113]
MFSDYFEIQSIGLPEDTHFILSKLFTRIHGVLKSESLNIGLGFPELSRHSPGSIVRCFGVSRELEQLQRNNGITHLEGRGMIAIKPIATVPPDAIAIAYRRDRSAEKDLAGFRQRQMRRRVRRAEHAQNQPETSLRIEAKSRLQDNEKAERPPYLLLEREGRRLPIHINTASLQINTNICQFSSYGLARKVEDKYSAVPMF